MVLRPSSPIVVKLVWLVAFLFAMIAIAVTAYWVGYGVAWRKTESVYNDAIILKAKAVELEVEILHLRNAHALMAASLYRAGINVPTVITKVAPDTTVCTLQVPTPVQAGKQDKR